MYDEGNRVGSGGKKKMNATQERATFVDMVEALKNGDENEEKMTMVMEVITKA